MDIENRLEKETVRGWIADAIEILQKDFDEAIKLAGENFQRFYTDKADDTYRTLMAKEMLTVIGMNLESSDDILGLITDRIKTISNALCTLSPERYVSNPMVNRTRPMDIKASQYVLRQLQEFKKRLMDLKGYIDG